MARRPGDRIRDALDNLRRDTRRNGQDATARVRVTDKEVREVLTAVEGVADAAIRIQEAQNEGTMDVGMVKSLQESLGKALFESIQVEQILE